MKSILFILTIIFALRLPITNSIPYNVPRMQTVSVASEEHEEIFKIKITIEDKIKNCDDKEFLNLNGMFLKNIHSDIVRSSAINHISLHDNFLKKIPHNILNHVPNLACFNLSHNNINLYVNNEIEHPHIRVLDLGLQRKSDFNDIAQLEVFDEEVENVYRNMVFNSTRMRMPSAEYLNLSGNDISSLSNDFNVSFPNLVRLDLTSINALTLKPDFFDVIPRSLRSLHLENNHLRNLTLRDIKDITSLYLDGNAFVQFDVASTKLKVLSLSNCMSLNAILFDTPYLEQLDMSRSNLYNAISVTFDMFRALRVLLLDHNKLSYVPVLKNMHWLGELSLRYNTIRHIEPYRFEYLVQLKKLSLRGNEINRLENNTFAGLTNLQYLDLSENQLNYLPPDWTSPLVKLQYLNLNSNHFGNIFDMGIYSLTSLLHLFVKNNTFVKITTGEIEPLPNLVTIHLV